ncbi:NAD(P)-dependent dehydrogenase (short-subunit alcohol dehydrogenase family) [Marinobacter sp. MBR-99]|jgi:NAD(P)-dependent dehydrogenase (short-subunit alcohol dehydrogenase family)|uniref:SDR family NAD(P)-dependent oxidoreductase n=1 Tax=Marinobacter sp. MBR-99 TaxID=3156461 RepID=UPI003394F40A
MTTVIAGISGAIGAALAYRYLEARPDQVVIGLCRDPDQAPEDLMNHPGVRLLAWDAEDQRRLDDVELKAVVEESGPIVTVIYAAGLLHDDGMFPEKRLEDIAAVNMARAFAVNATGFGLLIQALLPWLRHREFKRIAAISAKVGSISDNGFGGWYAYRSSKAALNMLVRNLSIELPRRCKPMACVALHPGTTESPLSAPFSQSLTRLKVHRPLETADNLIRVLDALDDSSNGRFFSWDGSELPW